MVGLLWAFGSSPLNESATIAALQPHLVFSGGSLTSDYDMGVDSSRGRRNWTNNKNGAMCMAYPSGEQWGAVFITFGPPTDSDRPGKDLSKYTKLSINMRGEKGGERVSIGLKDNTDPDNGRETKIEVSNLTKGWKTYTFPLSDFKTADKTRLYVVTEFVFEPGTPAETVCFNKIQYLP
ncbi:MAG: hypothetical protein AB4426_29610 [Xenococcaceae cyanobacterium]